MRKIFRLAVLLLAMLAPLGINGMASAQDFNHIIIVYASVPEQRGLYVDKDGLLIKIAGNTAKNIEPQAFSLNNQLLPMTDSIMRQYQDFLKSHDYHLEASKIYYEPHYQLSVSNQPNGQRIQVDSEPATQTLSLSL